MQKVLGIFIILFFLISILFLQCYTWNRYLAEKVYQRVNQGATDNNIPELNKELINSLRLAIRLNSLMSEYQFKMGELFLAQRNYSLAQNRIIDSLILEPANAGYHLKLAEYYILISNPEAADKEFLKAEKLDFSNSIIHYEIAKYYILDKTKLEITSREYKNAIFFAGKKLQTDIFEELYSNYAQDYPLLEKNIPHADYSRYCFAEFLRNKNEPAKSIKQYKEAIILAHKSGNKNIEANAYNWIGLVYVSLNAPKTALRYFQPAVKLSPGNSWFTRNLGNCYFSLGLYKQAKDSLEKALVIEPTNSENFISLGYLYEKIGLTTQAKNFYLEAIHFASGESAEAYKKQARDRLNKLK